MAIVSLGKALTNIAAADPNRPAVTSDGVTTTRAELESLANRMARAFQAMGVKQGDYVTIGLPNSAKFYAAAFAVWKLGAVPQPVSPRLPIRERQAIVELANSPIVVGADGEAHPGRPCLALDWMPDESLSYAPLEDKIPPAWKAPTSGGSTGRPKLIVASDPGVLDDEGDPGQGVQRNGVMMVPGPMYHNAPFSYSSRGLANGNHVVTMSRFDAEKTMQGIQEHKADWMLLVPTMMLRMWRVADRESYDMSSLRVIWHMAAPCPMWLKEAWIEWLGGERIFELYAGTEAQAVTVIRGDDWMAHKGSVGRCVIGEMKVLDENGNQVEPGTVGEIYMRPPAGRETYKYIGAEPKKSSDGWESLGDMGYMDADGYVYLSDRLSDMILSGGANIYPAEIEAAMEEHPAISSSAAIGLPDEDLGSKVHGLIYLAPGQTIDLDDLRTFLAERLVRYKIPRTFEIMSESLRDDAGKVRRSALRAERVNADGTSKI